MGGSEGQRANVRKKERLLVKPKKSVSSTFAKMGINTGIQSILVG